MPAPTEDAISAPPAADRQPSPAPQAPPAPPTAGAAAADAAAADAAPAGAAPAAETAEPAPSKLPPSIASAFAAAAYALQHGDPRGEDKRDQGQPGQGLMPGLYASMVGAPSRDYYLKLFERFDALGKGLPTWNACAGLFTLPWCGLRGLWREGALYALAAGGTALLWTVELRPLLALPPAMAHGIDAALVLLAIAVPGLGANTVYWRHVRKHTLQIIGEAPNMADAHERLARHAPTAMRKRLAVLGGAILTAGAAAAAALAVAARTATAPQTISTVVTAPAVTEPAPPMATAATPPSAPPPAPAAAALPAPPVPAAAEARMAPPLPAAPLAGVQPAAVLPPSPAPTPTPTPPATEAAAQAAAPKPPAQGTPTAKAAEPSAAPVAPAKPQAAKQAEPAKTKNAAPAPAEPAKSAKSGTAKPAEQAKAAKQAEPTKAGAAKPALALEPGNYYINIGAFSDSANAERVVARLEKAKIPTLKQTLHSNKGEIVRVRSGPFAKQQRADQAAGKIRKMGMEATVFHHAPQEETRSSRR